MYIILALIPIPLITYVDFVLMLAKPELLGQMVKK